MRICWAQYLWIAMVIVLGTASFLTGCGAKGDLYLPQEQSSEQQGGAAPVEAQPGMEQGD